MAASTNGIGFVILLAQRSFALADMWSGIILLGIPAVGQAADKCPPELTQAKAALKSAQAAKAPLVAKGQDIQAPRSPYAGAGAQDVQAPRAQDIQAPRTQDIQAPRVKQAGGLVRESEAACKKGDMALSTRKATEALGLLGK